MASSKTPGDADSAKGYGVNLLPHGLVNTGQVYANLSSAILTEEILARHEAVLTDLGAVAAYTGKYTGRSPQDRYIVEDAQTKNLVDWGNVNRPMSEGAFDRLLEKV